jgi:hypothetical protein
MLNSLSDAVLALEAVPDREPVNDPENTLAVTDVVTDSEFMTASDPDTITFLQLGIVYLEDFFCG